MAKYDLYYIHINIVRDVAESIVRLANRYTQHTFSNLCQ